MKSLDGVSLGLRRYIRSSVDTSERDTDENIPFRVIVGLMILHAPLMLIFLKWPILATLHSIGVLLLGLFFLISDSSPARVAWVIAYIAGAELLWRGMNAALVWEYGKYATLLLSILVLLKYRKKFAFWPILLLGLMVPGILIMPGFNREDFAFQLAGLITLAVASMMFSAMTINRMDLQKIFLAIILPSLAVAALIAFNISTKSVTFSGRNSNEVVSDGIGANQVTTILSLGSTASFFFIFLVRRERRVRFLMIGIFLLLAVASTLTFSRSGLWTTMGAILSGAFFLFQDRRRIPAVFAVFLAVGLAAYFVVFPWLNDVTDGALLARFTNLNSTGRAEIIEIDYQLFLDHPVFGVGVGQSPYYHIPVFGYKANSHTEYSRLLAEHGSFGIAIIALMIVVLFSYTLLGQSKLSKSISVSCAVWALLYMTHSATRLVAPSFMFGLAAANLLLEGEYLSEK